MLVFIRIRHVLHALFQGTGGFLYLSYRSRAEIAKSVDDIRHSTLVGSQFNLCFPQFLICFADIRRIAIGCLYKGILLCFQLIDGILHLLKFVFRLLGIKRDDSRKLLIISGHKKCYLLISHQR